MLPFWTPAPFKLLVNALIMAGDVFSAVDLHSLPVLFRLTFTTIFDLFETPGRMRAQASFGVALAESSIKPMFSIRRILAQSNFRQ